MTDPSPDLARFRDAVRLRDRCREAAMAHHERCGLTPSFAYANATYDAIIDLLREDERRHVLAGVSWLEFDAGHRTGQPRLTVTGDLKVLRRLAGLLQPADPDEVEAP